MRLDAAISFATTLRQKKKKALAGSKKLSGDFQDLLLIITELVSPGVLVNGWHVLHEQKPWLLNIPQSGLDKLGQAASHTSEPNRLMSE